MRNGISYRQYRSVDLFMFAVILLISQFLIVRASTVWFAKEIYVVSPVAAVTAIVMMRWGAWGAIHAVLGGGIYCLLSGGGIPQLAVFAIGNLGGLLGLAAFRVREKQSLCDSTGAVMVYGILVQGGMLLGRALIALICGLGADAALGLITTDILSFVFTLVILWIAKRVNGLFEDQKHYLLRLHKEAEETASSTAEDSSGRGT